MSVTTYDKASRLLATRSVQVRYANQDTVAASVLGDHGLHDIRWTRMTGWSCSCPAFGRCSHLEAVSSVTMRPVTAKAKS